MSGGTPCAGELRFWEVVQSSLRTIARELKRANKLKALEIKYRHAEDAPGLDGPVVWGPVARDVTEAMESEP